MEIAKNRSKEAPLGRALIFRLGTSRFGLPLSAITEVFRLVTSPTQVIGAPPLIWGVINHHGQVLTVVRMGIFLGVESKNQAEQVILVDMDGEMIGLAVEQIESLEDIRTEGPQIQERRRIWCHGNLLEMIDLPHFYQTIQMRLAESAKTI